MLQVGSTVRIYSHNDSWEYAEIVGTRKDTLDGTRDVFIVEHPHFANELHFYMQADSQGRHYQPGNAAYWI